MLNNLHTGDCNEADLQEIKKLVITNLECEVPDFNTKPWNDAILVTSRHLVRSQWNTETLFDVGEPDIHIASRRHIELYRKDDRKRYKTGSRWHDNKTNRKNGRKSRASNRDESDGNPQHSDRSQRDQRRSNGYSFDTSEHLREANDDGTIVLQYPPALILFKPEIKPAGNFEGLPKGIIPIAPHEATFSVTTPDKKKQIVRRRQFAMTPGYVFTDFKLQGQTIEFVLIDLAEPVTGGPLMLFNAYVGLSGSRG